jgi:D-alanyl-D-alanine carboxypeptidase/D-alanyl-D-alanine-endopeptidase (penicillin-binding protein 4)
MKRFLALLAFVISGLISAPPVVVANDIQTGIYHLLGQARPGTNIGMIVTQVSSGRVLFAQRADYLFGPASVLKLFTAVAALHFLKPDFHFNTSLLTNGSVKNHILYGDLFVKFSGDPELTTADVNNLITKLAQIGVQEITGHVYIDNTDYSFVPYPPGWLWDDLSYGYAAPLNAVIIDRNKFILHLEPSKQDHAQPKLSPIIPAGVAHFINDAQTTAHNEKGCPLTIYSDLNSNYHVSGCISRIWSKQRRTLAVRDPFIYARVLIATALQKDHIRYAGNITARAATATMNVLVQHQSPSLAIMLREMLKKSDNLTTDSLLKKIGQLYFKQPGSWQNGLAALKKILSPTGIDFKKCLINDGAGLSRYNLITPAQFAALLNFAYRDSNIINALWPALPIAGQDGTLAGRMQPVAAGGRVHAKTGTMTGISALAGYINTKHHGMLSFAIMVNGFVGKDRPFKHLQDQICEYLITN